MRMGWFALAVLAGCPSPEERVVVLVEGEVTATLEPSLTVTGLDWSMTFADASRVRMPRSLQVGNVEMLGTGQCPNEDLAGIALYPAVIASASEPSAQSEANIVWEGPGVVRVRVTYIVNYACATTQALSGASTFTFFPSGRINRVDIVTPSSSVITPGESCSSCGSTAVFGGGIFTSFYRFARMPMFTTPASAEITQINGAGPSEGCVETGDRRLGMAYLPNPSGIGARVFHDAWIFDWRRGGGTNLQPNAETVTSNLVVHGTPLASANDCTTTLRELEDVPLDINGAHVQPEDDGTYEIETEDRSLALAPGSVELPHGFAVRLPVKLEALHHMHVTRGFESDEEDVRFSVQAIEDDHTLLWIDSPIQEGHFVHIEYD